MGEKLTKLAGRFKKALEEEEKARKKAEKARKAWLIAAAHERKEFLVELANFGRQIGALQVKRKKGTLVFGYGSRSLEFREGVEGNRIELEFAAADGDEAVVLTEEGEWMLEGTDYSIPFIPEGLEQMLVAVLGLPHPDGKAPPPRPEPTPAKDEAKEAAPPETEAPSEADARPPAEAKGPSHGSPAELGRSGTRGYKPAKDLHPGAVMKDLKGPGPK